MPKNRGKTFSSAHPLGLRKVTVTEESLGVCVERVYERSGWYPWNYFVVSTRNVPCIPDPDDDDSFLPIDEIPIDDIVDIIDQLLDDPNGPAGPDDIFSPTDLLSEVIDDYISTIDNFADCDSPCRQWYQDSAEILDEARNGKCGRCSEIAAEVGSPDSSNAANCAHELSGETNSAHPHGNFSAVSQELSRACKRLCR